MLFVLSCLCGSKTIRNLGDLGGTWRLGGEGNLVVRTINQQPTTDLETNSQPVEKGHPRLRIALSPGSYLRVMEAARTRVPVETFGALVGRVGSRDASGQEWTVVEAAIPVKLVPSGTELVPDMSAWNELTARAADTSRSAARTSSAGSGSSAAPRIVGWFYSDPAVGIFEPRIDFAGTGRLLAENGSLLLLIDPVANQGGFYSLQDGRFTETGGFYQSRSGEAELASIADIPWSGQVRGAAGWLGSADASFSAVQGAISPGSSVLGVNTIPFAPQKPGQNGSTGAPGYDVTNAGGESYFPQEAGEVLYHHDPASRDLTTDPLSEDGATRPQATADLQPAPTTRASLAYVSPSLDTTGSRTLPNSSYTVTPAKKDRRPLLAAVGALLGVLIVIALAVSLLLPQLGSNTISQTASTPTPLAENAAQSTATTPPTAVAAVRPATASPEGAALAGPATGQDLATGTEPPATATAVPPTQEQAAPSPTAQSKSTATAAPTETPGTTYKVKAGDTLIAIARQYGTTAKDIMAANNLTSSLIRVGQVLMIPPPSTPTPGASATP